MTWHDKTWVMAKISHDSETPAQGQQVITACAFIHYNFDGVEKLFWPKRVDMSSSRDNSGATSSLKSKK
jgi:hypothetical protein